MPNAWGFTARGDGSPTLEIDIYDIVADSFWYDAVSARQIRAVLKSNPDASLIKLRINSEGGDVFEGFAIYNLLCEHKGRVEAQVDGLAASIASVIAMAADQITMASNAWMMIHNAWGGISGGAADLRNWADVLEKMSAQSAQIYATRTGQTQEQVLALMDTETWMTAAEAKALGFCDVVTPMKSTAQPQQNASASAFAMMRAEDYRNVPPALRSVIDDARKSASDSRAAVQREREASRGSADPSHEPHEESMNLKKLAKLLGLSESASEEAFETATSEALDARKSAESKAERAEAVALQTQTDLKASQALVTRYETALGEKGDAAFGALDAHMGNSKKLIAAEALVAEQAKAADDTKRAQLVKEALDPNSGAAHAGKLTQPVADLYASKPVAELEAYLKAAARVIPEAVKPPDATTGAAVLKHNGKTYAEMNGPERAELSQQNEALFNQMRAAQSQTR